MTSLPPLLPRWSVTDRLEHGEPETFGEEADWRRTVVLGPIHETLSPQAKELADDLFRAFNQEARSSTRQLLADPAVAREARRMLDHLLAGVALGLEHGDRWVDPILAALASPLGVLAADAGTDTLRGLWVDLFETVTMRLDRIATLLVGPDRAAQAQPELMALLHRIISERSHISVSWQDMVREQREQRCVEEERRRIARELHDWFGGNLSLAVRRLELFRASSQDGHVEAAQEVLENVFEGLRRYSRGLRLQHPSSDIGSALRAYIAAAGPHVPRTEVTVRGADHHLSGTVRDEMLTVLQEAVRNVHTHSGAQRAIVIIEFTADRACAIVQDDGVGFDLAQVGVESSGIAIMRERMEALDGLFEVTSAPGEGTRVELWIPIGIPIGKEI